MCKVFDSTNHSVMGLKKTLIADGAAQQSAKQPNYDSMSLVNLFANQELDSNFIFLTSRPFDLEQRRAFFQTRSDILQAVFKQAQEDTFLSMTV